MTTTAIKGKSPLDKILRFIEEASSAPEIKILVVHRRPDIDAWLCLWLARTFIPNTKSAKVVFVNAGTMLPGSENDPSILHFDTGGGEFDQHGLLLNRSSSARLMAEKLGLDQDSLVWAGIKHLVELATKVDNIEPIDPTSIHFLAEWYHHYFRDLPIAERLDLIRERMFEHFDVLFNGHQHAEEVRQEASDHISWNLLPNGVRVASIWGHPEYRSTAFEQGADVAFWTQPHGKKGFDVGIQVGRNSPVRLQAVAAALRRQEATARKLQLDPKIDLRYVGLQPDLVPGWFLHESNMFVACGTRTHILLPENRTNLSLREIQETLFAVLKKGVIKKK